MDTGKIIEGIETRMFDPSYFSALKTSYSDQVSAGYFEMEEKEYAQGAEFLIDAPHGSRGFSVRRP